MADISEGDVPAPVAPEETENANEDNNGKLSSKSSDISIEEIGPEEAAIEKSENAEVLLPEDPPADEEKEDVIEEIKAVKEEVIEEIKRDSVSEDEEEEEEDDDDDFEDETLVERLVGLSEMFPEGLANLVSISSSGMVSGLKWAFGASRSLTWVLCSSATIMFLPIMIETERFGMEEAQKQQQRQILLGPGAAMSGGNAQANAPLPQTMS